MSISQFHTLYSTQKKERRGGRPINLEIEQKKRGKLDMTRNWPLTFEVVFLVRVLLEEMFKFFDEFDETEL